MKRFDQFLFWWILWAIASAIALSGTPWIFPKNGKLLFNHVIGS